MKPNQKKPKKLTHYLDERSGEYIPVADKKDKLKVKSVRSSAKKFKASRELFRLQKRKPAPKPAPGPRRLGVYYPQQVQWAFQDYACIDLCMLVPPVAGGKSKQYLYLTATNGTAKGVEVVISYLGQDAPFLKIYDWSIGGKEFHRARPCSQLPQYFSSIDVNDRAHKYCRVINETREISSDTWKNKVMLYNFKTNMFDEIYSHVYPSTLQQQKMKQQGTWGPIVETFQTVYGNLNPLGFYEARLYNDASNSLLTAANSIFDNRDNDTYGATVAYRSGNHTYYVE